MTVIIQSVVKLLITAYLLFGFYTLFCGFVEKNRKKKIVGTIVLTVPTVLIAVLIIVLYRMYGE
ncbi:MAG: hypothetical protein IKQ91_02920 [Oscillospiraceae bacterium]|nr:hypothetical protein [Oscillospiraceae bacterium]